MPPGNSLGVKLGLGFARVGLIDPSSFSCTGGSEGVADVLPESEEPSALGSEAVAPTLGDPLPVKSNPTLPSFFEVIISTRVV